MVDQERRKFLKAAAWTIPAIAVAVSTPALAASDECPDNTFVHNDGVVNITIKTGREVEVIFLKDYPYATALNVNGHIIVKQDRARTGDLFHADLSALGICDPTFIQVDGTNTHYYGNGVFR